MPEHLPRVVSVGRLDLNSEGLLLLTNDGGLARRLELPSNGWIRRYRVRVHGVGAGAGLGRAGGRRDRRGRAIWPDRGGGGLARDQQYLAERRAEGGPQPGGPQGDGASEPAGHAADPGGLRTVPAREPGTGRAVDEISGKVLREQLPDITKDGPAARSKDGPAARSKDGPAARWACGPVQRWACGPVQRWACDPAEREGALRIIAGRWRGRTLRAPPGTATRPTAERLRQSAVRHTSARALGAAGWMAWRCWTPSPARGRWGWRRCPGGLPRRCSWSGTGPRWMCCAPTSRGAPGRLRR